MQNLQRQSINVLPELLIVPLAEDLDLLSVPHPEERRPAAERH